MKKRPGGHGARGERLPIQWDSIPTPPPPALYSPLPPLQVRALGLLAAAYQTHRSVSLSNSGIHLIIALTTAY